MADAVFEIFVRVRRGPVMTTLCAIVAVLLVCSAIGQIGRLYFNHPTMLGFVPLFYVDEESSFSTWYQSVALLACASLLAVIAVVERSREAGLARYWIALAIIFLALSADEVATVHERTTEPLRRALGREEAILEPTWLLSGIAFAAGVAVVFARFLLKMERSERMRYLLAGGIYLAGAIGVEMATADFTEGTPGFAIGVHLEELLEMAGILIFLDALLRRLGEGTRISVAVIDRA